MPRPKLYNTREEQLAAGRERSKRYYQSHILAIRATRSARYHASKVPKPRKSRSLAGRPATSLTDEERRLKNRLKNQLYYKRNNERIKQRRRMGGTTLPQHESFNSGMPSRYGIWREHLQYHAAQLSKAMGGRGMGDYLESLAVAYMECGFPSVLEAPRQRLEKLLSVVHDFQMDMVNKLGAGSHLDDSNELVARIKQAIHLIMDMEEVAMLHGVGAIRSLYSDGELHYQELFFSL